MATKVKTPIPFSELDEMIKNASSNQEIEMILSYMPRRKSFARCYKRLINCIRADMQNKEIAVYLDVDYQSVVDSARYLIAWGAAPKRKRGKTIGKPQARVCYDGSIGIYGEAADKRKDDEREKNKWKVKSSGYNPVIKCASEAVKLRLAM